MSQSQLSSGTSSPNSPVTTPRNMYQNPPTSGQRTPDSSSQAHKLPLGAIASPLGPFFRQRAKICALEKVESTSLDAALADLDSDSSNKSRNRSTSQSSKNSEGRLSAVSFSSISSRESYQSIATPISTLDDELLPPTLPRIAFEDWSKFGISLFTPKLSNPHSKIYYHYPSMSKQKTNVSPLSGTGQRARSRSSTVHGCSLPKHIQHDVPRNFISSPSSHPAVPNRPNPGSPLTRHVSLRHPLERNYTR
ncbi:hypothetical protein VP01_2779g3 [Puccinia sorghi]|uniref:Uncharacterized protein n=1 Tax=Puccinia sorghi TaxID=27349 RepID=A0A0L6V4I8_9BASI|nr:hypothetical protein VP01_2779g3 [Puccinia sorghi]